MAVGWRLNVADLTLLVARGTGRVEMDLVTATAMLDGDDVSLVICDEVCAWVARAKERDSVLADAIGEFAVRIDFAITTRTHGRSTEQTHDLQASSRLISANDTFIGRSHKRELWTRKAGTNDVWFVRDI